MKSPDSSSHIELTTSPSNSERSRQSPPRRSKQKSSKYLPQKDEESHPTKPQSRPSLTLWSKVCRNKAINLPILFILCIAIIDVPILGAGTSYYLNQVTLKFKMQESMVKPLKFMAENLKADPIMDLRIMEQSYPCPLGFQIIKLGVWPGSSSGCLCDNGDLYRESCSSVNSPRCTTELQSSFRINLFEWGGLNWCAKKAVLGTDYIRQAVCPSGYKECYPGGCFSKECPITRIVSGDGGGLVLEKSQGKVPLVNMQLTFGETSCDMREVESYKMTANKEEECDKYGISKEMMTKLGSQTAYYSFLENSFPYSFMRLREFVGNMTATSSVLSSVNRIKTAKLDTCQDIDEKAIDDFMEVTPNTVNLACLALVLIIQLKNFIDIARSLAPNSETKLFKNSTKLVKSLSLLNILAFLPIVIMIANFAHVYQISLATRKYFEEYYSLGCFFGTQGDLLMNDYVEALKIANDGSWIYLALLVSKILSGWLCFRLYVVKKKSSIGSSNKIFNFSVKNLFGDYL